MEAYGVCEKVKERIQGKTLDHAVRELFKSYGTVHWKKAGEDPSYVYGYLNGAPVVIEKKNMVVMEVKC